MADEQTPPAGDNAGAPPLGAGTDGEPIAINILAQYVKDLSFENPKAPASLQAQNGQPDIDIQVNVAVNKQEQKDVYEVVLTLTGKATTKGTGDVGFIVELSYGGLFALQNVPDEHLQLFLIIEAPRMIFPFARRIFADAVRDGGFPPLMLDPIDFAQLYMARQQQMQAEQGGGEKPNEAGGDTPNIILPN
ncbi:MAG: protein-export chaperone SecB [Pacificimonas sp.]